MKSGGSGTRRAVFLGAILALTSAGVDGSGSGLASWSAVEDAVEAQATGQVVGGQYPALFAVVLKVLCFQCALEATIGGAIDWVKIAQCLFICDAAF